MSGEALDEDVWRERERAHQARVDRLTAPYLRRRRDGRAHPVEDFLFTYYSHRPGQLRRWHPGAGVALRGEGAGERAGWRHYRYAEHTAYVDVEGFLRDRAETVRFVRDLLSATLERPAHLSCFGLHEWAMVYRQPPEEVRHASWPLRLGHAGTDAVVERHRIRCSHHDAFRFFTEAARPLNALEPQRDSQVAFEQPGCLHAGMDVYKWAYKLAPAVPSELTVDCFELAREVRELDMRASPYDLSELGYAPVPIETAEGKAEYVAAQRAFSERAQALRGRLLAACDQLLR
ncbi:MAG TPA: 3-methyladenine DNA glycosylase [Segeticoccus sp.]|uniref:3-methyladenine DNA glycosylase n=1 Tax=Segeticoccus sp. TaxID=2706531 RepID=UPI002D7FD7FC|nr:3-methyladenine DNA glycosylase [Segeticoccus sp.]HET8600105.1 3-methyladenine DNA glycosylase [Segeticoccus sp.]